MTEIIQNYRKIKKLTEYRESILKSIEKETNSKISSYFFLMFLFSIFIFAILSFIQMSFYTDFKDILENTIILITDNDTFYHMTREQFETAVIASNVTIIDPLVTGYNEFLIKSVDDLSFLGTETQIKLKTLSDSSQDKMAFFSFILGLVFLANNHLIDKIKFNYLYHDIDTSRTSSATFVIGLLIVFISMLFYFNAFTGFGINHSIYIISAFSVSLSIFFTYEYWKKSNEPTFKIINMNNDSFNEKKANIKKTNVEIESLTNKNLNLSEKPKVLNDTIEMIEKDELKNEEINYIKELVNRLREKEDEKRGKKKLVSELKSMLPNKECLHIENI